MCKIKEFFIIQNEDKSQTFRVKPTWKEKSFDLLILTEDAWNVHVSEDYLENLAKHRKQDVTEYFNNIKTFLTDGDASISFKLSTTEDAAEFVITQKIGIRVVIFFTISLTKGNFQETVFTLLEEFNERNTKLANQLVVLQKENDNLERQKGVYEDKLIEFIERKTKWEREMYSNFLLLLNEKKKRLNFLTFLLKRKNVNLNEQSVEESDVPILKNRKRCSTAEKVTDQEENSSEEYSTDNDDSEIPDGNNTNNLEPVPSTSTQNPKSFTQKPTSFTNLDDEEEAPGLLLPKRMRKSTSNEVTVVNTQVETNQTTTETKRKVTKREEKAVESKKSGRRTPELNFSTQDLIDRM